MITVAAALAASLSFAAPPPALAAEFRARDQALLTAVTSGDRAEWDRAMAAEAIYVDEDGRILSKADLLAQIVRPAAGNTARIDITDYTVHASDDLAVVVHRDAEAQEWHGHSLKADYITTETWRRQAGGWKLVLSHVYVVAKAPPAIQLPASQLDEYVGRYEAAPGVVATIRRDGDQLTMELGKTGAAKPLLVEVPDLLFVASEPRLRDLIQRDATGRVTGFIERREGEDIRWIRLP
jgi:ketosteroid isomerase-like protein